MGLLNKKEKIPDIPPAPSLPNPPESEKQPEKKDLPELPSFPVGSRNENMNQEMVKSAVTDMPSPEENEAHVEIPESLHIKEEQKGESMIPPKPSVQETISEPPTIPSITDLPRKTLEINTMTPKEPITKQIESITKQIEPITKQIGPIFVRIDKFQSAQKNFESIKDKMKDIESVLKKIKDVKLQEETELKGWTEDVEKIKTRLAEIDSGIFDQI